MTSELLSGLAAANLSVGLAIILVMAVRGPVRRRFGAAMAYRLWLVPLVAGVAVFVPVPKGLAPSLPVAAVPQEMLLIFAPDVAAPAAPIAAAAHGPVVSLPDLPTLLLGAWLAGALVAVGLTLLAHRRGMRSFGRLKASGARGPLRAARNGLGPALVGVVRPRLVLPADFETRFSEREQALILAHERHHGLNGDPRINALAVLLGCLNWFNPLVHLAAHLLRVDQELACDAAVVGQFPGERRTYAEALLKSQQACIPMPLGCTWPGRSPKLLQERLTMLAHDAHGRARLTAGAVLVGGLCLTAGAAAWAASAATTPSAPEVTSRTSAVVASQGPLAAQRPVAPTDAPLGEAPSDPVAPSTIGMACFGNNCGGSVPGPRDAAALNAAIRAGDAKAAALAGGSAQEVLAALSVQPWIMATGGQTLAERAIAESAQFVQTPNGNLAVRYDLKNGGSQTFIPPDLEGVTPPAGTPNGRDVANGLAGRPAGSTPITEPWVTPDGLPGLRVVAYRGPDGTVIPSSPAAQPQGGN